MRPEELWDLEVVCPDPAGRRLTVAFHEAAHAVVGRSLGGLCRKLEVYYQPDWERGEDGYGVLGRCHIQEELGQRAMCVHYLAAPIAAWRTGHGVFPSPPAWETFREYARTLDHRGHDAAVLVRAISFEDDQAGAYAESWERATWMVEDLWANIGRVARELDRRGKLTGPEFYDLLGATAEYEAWLAQVEKLVAWNLPGGYLWLSERGYFDDPPDPVFLFELEDGYYDEDLDPGEAGELAADIRKRLKDYPGLL